MGSSRFGELLLARTACSAANGLGRPQAVLETLHRVVPCDGSWRALADPLGQGCHSVASVDLDRPVVDRLSGPSVARDIDPMRSLLAAARLVRGAGAGVVLHADGGCEVLPGLEPDALLAPGSPVLDVARERIDDGTVHASFHWPRGGPHAPGGHVRVSVLTAPSDAAPGLTGLALLSPATDVRGLTPRELQVLGLLVEGCSNQDIARALVVAPRTVAAHLEHVLGKLQARTRTVAAVRAEREGLYVPSAAAHGSTPRQVHARSACGADDGNRTRILSLGS